MTNQQSSVRAAVVGATGIAGQQFLAALSDHPFIRVTHLAASARSAGKAYAEAIRQSSGQVAWYGDGPLDPRIASLEVLEADKLDARDVDVVFTCVDAGPARELEPRYAEHAPVISTASAFRMEADVPLLLPGINMDHIPLVEKQKKARGWKGFIVPNPNCTTVGLAVTLAPLHRAFGIRHVHMVSMQAVSGAGRTPGVPSMDILDNILPYIPKEEEKVGIEAQKVLGRLTDQGIEPATFPISATCTRVPVLEGHTEAVHITLEKSATADQITSAWREWGNDFVAAGYPSCPESMIHVHDDPFRPQVRLDRDMGDGMTTVIGRLRPDATVENGWKYMLVSHNTKMGAAKGCILLAEHLVAQGLITGS